MRPLKRVHSDRFGRFYETPDGDRFPSVTNILGIINKPGLLNWYASTERAMVTEAAANLWEDAPIGTKMSRSAFLASLQSRLGTVKAGQKALAAAGDIGSQCHALIEWTLRSDMKQLVGPAPRISDPAMWAFMAWEDWRRTVNLEPLWIEQNVYSKRHQFAGTLDLVATLDLKDKYREYGRVLAVIDWKTGKAIYAESKLQSVAYSFAYAEMGHAEEPPPGLIVRLPKTEKDPAFETVIVHQDEHPELMRAFISARNLWNWTHKEELARKPEPVRATA